ncbi:hypothetical protein [Desertivirga xinjiangensis]|uniref:hypothetical protein n=1 Tax=Desertivirga xinjiangensis TaxID=539206 RepID=UPI00210BAEF0|nr:hypothetical protein [Pedobacter xinjiangensis]
MKTYLIAALLLTACTWTAQSQTTGTNVIGFGVSSQTTKNENESSSMINSEQKSTRYSLTYGHFINENARIGVTAFHSDGSSEYSGLETKSEGYGGALHYQKYYPLFKKFYAFAGGRGRYMYSKDKSESENSSEISMESNFYGIGAYGGAAFFLSKRFAFEVQLLSADFSYSKSTYNNLGLKSTQTNLNISSTGAINDLGFSIYFLF